MLEIGSPPDFRFTVSRTSQSPVPLPASLKKLCKINKSKLKILKFIIIVLFLNSCTTNKNVLGIYKSNFADVGFFYTTINFKNNGTFEYNFSGDLVNQDLTGTFKINKNKVYLKFLKEKGEIESKNDSLSITDRLSGNYLNYNLKNENGIKYHIKYLLQNQKLFIYRTDNGNLVKYAKKYSERKRFIFFGPTWKMKRFYLKKLE